MPRKTAKNKRVVEKLHHFICSACRKWWSVGDAPASKKEWFCPWCGVVNVYTKPRQK